MRTFGAALLEASVANFRVGGKYFPKSLLAYTHTQKKTVTKLVNSSAPICQKP